MSNLTSFIGALKDGGARANQYEVRIAGPGAAAATIATDFRFLVKATTVPSFTIGEVPLAYRGRQVFVSGDRTYDTWSITVLADQDMNFYKAFAAWSNLIADAGNEATAADGGYYGTGFVTQQNRKGSTKNGWVLHDIWPQSLSGFDYAWDSNDTVAEYTVDFRFNFMNFDFIGSGAISAGTSGPGLGGEAG